MSDNNEREPLSVMEVVENQSASAEDSAAYNPNVKVYFDGNFAEPLWIPEQSMLEALDENQKQVYFEAPFGGFEILASDVAQLRLTGRTLLGFLNKRKS